MNGKQASLFIQMELDYCKLLHGVYKVEESVLFPQSQNLCLWGAKHSRGGQRGDRFIAQLPPQSLPDVLTEQGRPLLKTKWLCIVSFSELWYNINQHPVCPESCTRSKEKMLPGQLERSFSFNPQKAKCVLSTHAYYCFNSVAGSPQGG